MTYKAFSFSLPVACLRGPGEPSCVVRANRTRSKKIHRKPRAVSTIAPRTASTSQDKPSPCVARLKARPDVSDIAPALVKSLPRYPQPPVTQIARLAVEQRLKGQGRGAFLLMDALQRSWQRATDIAAMAVVVDAKDAAAVAFCRHFDFTPLQSDARRHARLARTARSKSPRTTGRAPPKQLGSRGPTRQGARTLHSDLLRRQRQRQTQPGAAPWRRQWPQTAAVQYGHALRNRQAEATDAAAAALDGRVAQ